MSNYFVNSVIWLRPTAGKRPPSKSLAVRTKAVGKKTNGTDSGPHIIIKTLRNREKKKLTVVISIVKAPNQVRALGCDVLYDSTVLKYIGYTRGQLIDKFDVFDARKLRDGVIRIGGFEARDDKIPPERNGELIKLQFELIGEGDAGLRLLNLKDDISSWNVEVTSSINH